MTTKVKTYDIKSPAKINIGLRVLSKRKDGYHNIETIFYPVKIFDDIEISIKKILSEAGVSDGVGVEKTGVSDRWKGRETGVLDGARGEETEVSVGEERENKTKILVKVDSNNTLKRKLDDRNNICHKTVKLFLDLFKINGSYEIKINIKKNIPVGAGLGGGSANAAAVLKILAKHFRKTNNAAIKRIALELGSDVPYFLIAKPAFATGRGEILKPLPKFKVNYKILVVNPGIHVSTAWAYKQVKRQKAKSKKLDKINKLNKNNKDKFVNDFEKVVFKKYPEIGKLKLEMYECGAVFAMMSGSGSTVYGFFASKKIKAAKKYFSSLKYNFFVT